MNCTELERRKVSTLHRVKMQHSFCACSRDDTNTKHATHNLLLLKS